MKKKPYFDHFSRPGEIETYVLFAIKIFSLPVPTRPGTRTFWQVPHPSRPEVKKYHPQALAMTQATISPQNIYYLDINFTINDPIQ